MLFAIMLTVVLLIVTMLSVVMRGVVAPKRSRAGKFCSKFIINKSFGKLDCFRILKRNVSNN